MNAQAVLLVVGLALIVVAVGLLGALVSTLVGVAVAVGAAGACAVGMAWLLTPDERDSERR